MEEGKSYRSPAVEQLGRKTGTSPTAARQSLETGRWLREQPQVADAALGGALSAAQAEAVCDGVATDASKAAELIERAETSSVVEPNDEVAKLEAGAVDAEEARRRLHAKCSLRPWTDREGAFHAHLYGHPSDCAGLWRALDPLRRRLDSLRRRDGQQRERFEALDYHALITLAAVAAGTDSVLSFADLRQLGLFTHVDVGPPPPPASDDPADAGGTHRSTPTEDTGNAGDSGRPAEEALVARPTTGSPERHCGSWCWSTSTRCPAAFPSTGSAARSPDGDRCRSRSSSSSPAAATASSSGCSPRAKRSSASATTGRLTSHQQSALDFVQPTCQATGCPARAGLRYDHREDWSKTHFTVYDLLDRLCPHHHRLETHDNWSLVDGVGKRAFVPPDDPRHPRATRPPEPAGRSPRAPTATGPP